MGAFMSGFGALLTTLCLVACLSLSCVPRVDATSGLRVGFYHRTCPSVEKIIFRSLYRSYKKDQKIAPGILRLAFHDCFVRGCDCSIMLDGPASEKMSLANAFTNQTYEALDCAKREVEKACPGVVSCSDVLQFAARDSVVLSGGYGWAVPAGRRDGFVSKIEDVTLLNLPSPFANISTLIEVFKRKGLTADQMVALSGAHTIGTASCFTFDNRIHTPKPDPSLHPAFARSLKKQCPTYARPIQLPGRHGLHAAPLRHALLPRRGPRARAHELRSRAHGGSQHEEERVQVPEHVRVQPGVRKSYGGHEQDRGTHGAPRRNPSKDDRGELGGPDKDARFSPVLGGYPGVLGGSRRVSTVARRVM